MDASELYALAVSANRSFLAQAKWNDKGTRAARTAKWSAVRAYAEAAGISFPEAMEAVSEGTEA